MPESPGSRPLPAHIAAQLRSAGGSADTGGQAWAGRNLGPGTSHTHLFPDDDGAAPAALSAALSSWRAGQIPETHVVTALRGTRLFVPVVAEVSHAEITADGLVADKEADMSLVSVALPDGRTALPVFSSTAGLTAWRSDARPVAVDVRRAALSAVQDGSAALVLDPGEDAAFVVRRPALWAVAQDVPWTPSYADVAVDDAVLRAAVAAGGILVARTEPGRGVDAVRSDGTRLRGGGPGPELTVVVQLAPGLDDAAVSATVSRFQRGLSTEEAVAHAVDSLHVRLT